MKKKITPIKDRIVVQTIKNEDKVGSIIIPESSRAEEVRGKVTAVGPKVEEIKVGDVVLFGDRAGTPMTMDDIDYRVMLESDVFAII